MKTETRFAIRLAGEADCPAILEGIRSLARYEKLAHEVVATEERLRESLFVRREAEVLIGECGGEFAGFALFFANYSTFLGRAGIYLEDLFVNEAYRGRGYGKALLLQLARLAVERGCMRMDWSCLDWNQSAIAFYQSLGAVPMSEWTGYRLQGEALTRLAASPGIH